MGTKEDGRMKIIFLDIDGVVCIPRIHGGALQRFNLNGRMAQEFNIDCVQRLNKIIESTGALVVISSMWRIDFWSDEEFELLKNFFKEQGVIGTLIGHTPYNDERIRGREIQEWLNGHPDVEKFVIIDDCDDMEHLMPYLVQTRFYGGIEDDHVERAIAMLM